MPSENDPLQSKEKRLLTKVETSKSLGFCTRTLDRYVREGSIRPLRMNDGRLMFQEPEIERFRLIHLKKMGEGELAAQCFEAFIAARAQGLDPNLARLVTLYRVKPDVIRHLYAEFRLSLKDGFEQVEREREEILARDHIDKATRVLERVASEADITRRLMVRERAKNEREQKRLDMWKARMSEARRVKHPKPTAPRKPSP